MIKEWMRRGLLLALVAATVAALTALTGMATSAVPYPGGGQRVQTTAVEPALPVVRQYRPFEMDAGDRHSAFPSATKLPDGRVLMMWRDSSGHLAKDGRIFSSVGDPLSGVWSAPAEVVLDRSAPTRDMRPGALSTIDGVVWLTYFYWEGGVPAGAWVTSSTDGGVTFGPSVRVDGGRPYAAISSPVVKVAGKLVTAWYGRNAGESVDTAWISTFSGTWSQLRIANAIGGGKAYNEPFALARGNTLMVLMRDGAWSGMAMRTSPDGGVTWNPLVHILDSATGNPASTWASNGNVYVVYRHTVTRDAMVAVSRDSGASWQADPVPLLRAPANLGKDSLGMVYGAPLDLGDLGDGLVWCPVAMERSLLRARVFVGWL